jgi:DNA-binding MarR family transcriptional regulator
MTREEAGAIVMRAMTQIGVIAQLNNTALSRVLEDGLSLAGFSLLHHFMVRNVDGQSPLSLANAFQVTKGAMTNTLQRLEAKGYVTVQPDPADGRAKVVRITRAGRAARDRALAAMTPEIAGLLGEIRVAEFAAALPFLSKLKDVLDRRRD